LIPKLYYAGVEKILAWILTDNPQIHSKARSDNGTNFVLWSKIITAEWTNVILTSEVQHEMAHKGVTWKSTTPYAPWRGGMWERLIGNVKYSLKRTIGRSLLTNTELQTLLCEIEAVVNTRPLTFQIFDPKDVSLFSSKIDLR
jgi:hypothetical protein